MSVVLTVPAVEAVLLFQRQECETCRGSGHLGPATGAKQADYGRSCPSCDGDGTVPLAEWVTVNAEPMVEEVGPCDRCGGKGMRVLPSGDVGDCAACDLSGQGEPLASWATTDALPDVECSTCGGTDWEWRTDLDGGTGTGTRKCRFCANGRRPLRAGDRVQIVAGEWPATTSRPGSVLVTRGIHGVLAVLGDLRTFPLPAPGAVVGTATVEWVGPIHDRSTYEHWPEADFVLSEHGRIKFMRWDGVGANDHYHSGWGGTEITGHDHLDWAAGRWAVRLADTEAGK